MTKADLAKDLRAGPVVQQPTGRHPRAWHGVSMVLIALVALAAPAHAFTVRGNVVNGTTGKPYNDAKVVIVNPSEGMMDEREVQARGGRFEITDLDPQAPIYLLRVDYDGVPYNEPLRVDGADQEITITVYEATDSWEGVGVSVPHLAASRHDDHLTIEQVFDVSNESSPPRTVTGETGDFRVFIPEEMDSLLACFVTALGVPVDRTPLPTDEPGVYRVEYPLRPGVTRVGLAYKVPYAAGEYTLDAKVSRDIGHMSIFAVSPEMQITSTTHTLQAGEPVHGMTAYALHGVSKGSTLNLTFSGGTSQALAAGQEVKVVPNDAHNIALFAMVPLLLILVGLVGATTRGPNPLADARVVRAHYELLVKRLARLDDLRAADAISDEAHRAAREELTTRLGALAMTLHALGEAAAAAPEGAPPQPSPAPAPARRGTA